MSTLAILLRDIEAFLRRHDMAPTTFSKEAGGDHNLMAHLRAGGDIRTAKADKLRDYMAAYDREHLGDDTSNGDPASACDGGNSRPNDVRSRPAA